MRFAPTPKNLPAQVDQLDKAGETILQLVHEAAGVAEQNSSRALSMDQKFSDQLRAAEDRIAELEAESATYRERADRAEQWLHTVYTEIEDLFFGATVVYARVPEGVGAHARKEVGCPRRNTTSCGLIAPPRRSLLFDQLRARLR